MGFELTQFQLLTIIFSAIGAAYGVYKALNTRIDESQKDVRNLERELYQLKIDLPQTYVAREDYIRGQTVIEAKLDAVAAKIENVQIKQGIKND